MNAPVLARQIEAAGFATVLITQMPFWAEKTGTPRTLAVEHPFGQTMGQPFDTATHSAVLRAALHLFNTTDVGTIDSIETSWEVPTKEAIAAWQPKETAPIVSVMGKMVRERLKGKRL